MYTEKLFAATLVASTLTMGGCAVVGINESRPSWTR